MMLGLHLLAAVLASWRLTELVVQDRITLGLRTRWPMYLWTCPRCVSVWAGLVVTALYVWWPWANWPLAFAWGYLVHLDWALARRQRQWPKTITVAVDDHQRVSIQRSDFPADLTAAALRSLSNGHVTPPVEVR